MVKPAQKVPVSPARLGVSHRFIMKVITLLLPGLTLRLSVAPRLVIIKPWPSIEPGQSLDHARRRSSNKMRTSPAGRQTSGSSEPPGVSCCTLAIGTDGGNHLKSSGGNSHQLSIYPALWNAGTVTPRPPLDVPGNEMWCAAPWLVRDLEIGHALRDGISRCGGAEIALGHSIDSSNALKVTR